MLKNPALKFVRFEYNAECEKQMKALFGDNFLGMSCERHPNAVAVAHFYDNGFKRAAIVSQYVIALEDKIEIVSEAEFKSKYCEEPTTSAPKSAPEQASDTYAFECFARPAKLNAINLRSPIGAILDFILKHSAGENPKEVSTESSEWSLYIIQKVQGGDEHIHVYACDSFLVFDGTNFSVADVSEFDRRYKRAV